MVSLCTVPQGFTFTNSTFCPHSVFMCFVWISEQTAIISLYSINWLVFKPRRSVFTARYGLDLYIYFTLILAFKMLYNSYILLVVYNGKTSYLLYSFVFKCST
jgi:hypothetical protein